MAVNHSVISALVLFILYSVSIFIASSHKPEVCGLQMIKGRETSSIILLKLIPIFYMTISLHLINDEFLKMRSDSTELFN